jgi:hypothetical protein
LIAGFSFLPQLFQRQFVDGDGFEGATHSVDGIVAVS